MADATVVFRPAGEPLRLTGQAGDPGVLRLIERSGGSYEPALLATLRDRLAPDAVSFDVGANIGPVTLAMSRLTPQGHVFAFEPAPSNFSYLVRNIEDNGAVNVTAERVALYDTDGPLRFTVSDDDPAGSHVPAEGTDGAATTVQAMTLDRFVEERGVTRLDLIKLDVEGAELRVLRGAAATLARFRPDLVFEVNPVALRRFHQASFRDLLALVRVTHPSVFSVDANGRLAAVLSGDHLARFLARHGVVNLVALARPARRERLGSGLARSVAAPLRGLIGSAALSAGSNRWRRPAMEFAVEPAFRLRALDEAVQGPPGGQALVRVRLDNIGRQWLSSDWTYHPVHASYRWYGAGGALVAEEGRRSVLPHPVGPGTSVTIGVGVTLPVEPGPYDLAVTLVQEAYAWFDQQDEGLSCRVPALVGQRPEGARQWPVG